MPIIYNGESIRQLVFNGNTMKKAYFNGGLIYTSDFAFSYTGEWEFDSGVNETDLAGDFQIRFLTSGVLTITDMGGTGGKFDIFLCGGGGKGGGRRGWYNNLVGAWQYGGTAGKGGAGSYANESNVSLSEQTYAITIGGETEATSFADLYSATGGTDGTNSFARGNPDWVNGTDGVTIDDVGVYAFGANSGNLYCRSNQDEVTPNSGNGGKRADNESQYGTDNVNRVQLGFPGSTGVIVIRNHRQ